MEKMYEIRLLIRKVISDACLVLFNGRVSIPFRSINSIQHFDFSSFLEMLVFSMKSYSLTLWLTPSQSVTPLHNL